MATALSTPDSLLNIPKSQPYVYTPPKGAATLTSTGLFDEGGNKLIDNSSVSDLTSGYPAASLASTPAKLPEPAPAPNPDAFVASVAPTTLTFANGKTYDQNGNEVTKPTTDTATQTGIDQINQIDQQTQTPEQKAASQQYDQNYQQGQQASQALQGKGQATLGLEQQYGVDKTFQQLQDLNQMIAERTNQYNQLYVNTAGRNMPIEFITGRQAVIKQQAAVELGALATTQAALSGNLKLAQDRADRVVGLQFQGAQQKLDDAKYFLGQNAATMTREETKQAQKISQAVTLQQKQLDRQKEARTFALTNGIQKPFYNIGGTVYRTSDGMPMGNKDEYISNGGRGDFSDVQNVTTSMAGEDLIRGDDGTIYVRDPSSPTGLRTLIQGIGGYQTTTNPIDGTIYSIKGGKASVMVDANGKVVNNGGSLVSSNPTEVVGGYDLTSYASSPNMAINTQKTYDKLAGVDITDAASAQQAINTIKPNSPITGQMVWQAAQAAGVDPKMLISVMQAETQLGTDGSVGSRQYNYGNVGNTDSLVAAGGSKGYATPYDGVLAVASNLSRRKMDSTGGTSAVDSNLINRLVMVATPDKATQQLLKRNVNQLIAAGDLQGARSEILTTVQNKMPVTLQEKVWGNDLLIPQMKELKSLLDQYKAAGGDTGFLTGTQDQIMQQVGRNKDPQAAKIGLQAGMALIAFRRQATGVQFSQKESQEYKSLFPSLDKIDASNTALIDQILKNAEIENRNTYGYSMGGVQNYDALMRATDAGSQYLLQLTSGGGSSSFDSIFKQNGW